MEVTQVPDIWYHVKIVLSERDLCKLEDYVRSGPMYTGSHEFHDLVKKIREAVGK
jgi:hypothetical protein